jgi:hypothetical protein
MVVTVGAVMIERNGFGNSMRLGARFVVDDVASRYLRGVEWEEGQIEMAGVGYVEALEMRGVGGCSAPKPM